MARWVYAVLDAGAAVSALGAARYFDLAWLKRPGAAALAVMSVFVPFVAWDVLVTAAGHWSFSGDYTFGAKLAGLPLEELMFFVAIPLVALSVWELCAKTGGSLRLLPASGHRFDRPRPAWYAATAGVCVSLTWAASWPGRGYSLLAGLAATAVWVGWLIWGTQAHLRRWLYFWTAMFGIFFLANSVLTGLPVVLYNPAEFSGWRVGTIPLEDWFYNFALVTGTVLAYEGWARRYRSKAA